MGLYCIVTVVIGLSGDTCDCVESLLIASMAWQMYIGCHGIDMDMFGAWIIPSP